MRDAVDEIQEAWARERPDLDVTSIGVITRLWRLAGHLERARRAGLAQLGTDAATLDALATLRRAGPPHRLRAGAMQRASLLTSGAISQRLDRLEAGGLVRRRPDRADGRVVMVELTARGRALVDEAVSGLMDQERELLAPFSAADRRTLARLLRRWLLWFERGAAGPSA